MGEFEIIARYFSRRSGREDVLLGVGDDAAVVSVPDDRRLVVAMDTLVEHVHFLPGTDPFDVGYRALAVNLSDLAAMGASPAWMTLSLSLPTADEQWLESFAAGLFRLADDHRVELIGGDTVHGPLVVTVQVAGHVESDKWLTRTGARPGDRLYVTGVPGEAAAGLALIKAGRVEGVAETHLIRRFLRPTPRVALGRALRRNASAAMDVSDGLLADLNKLCQASGCGADLNLDALPPSQAMARLFTPEQCERFVLGGGDDYELLFTVPADRAAQLPVSVRCIGTIVAGNQVRCLRAGREIERQALGYDHFGADHK